MKFKSLNYFKTNSGVFNIKSKNVKKIVGMIIDMYVRLRIIQVNNPAKHPMDHSPIGQPFKSVRKQFYHCWKQLPKFSEIVKFGCKILKKVENIVM